MKRCPCCNTLYPDDDLYCLKDNRRLIHINDEELKELAKSTNHIVNSKIVVCPNCNHKNKVLEIDLTKDTTTCSNCNVDFYYGERHRAQTIKNNRNPNIYNKSNQQTDNKNILKCPKCGSTAISTGARGFSIVTGFLGAGQTVNRCGNCGHKWKPKG